MPNITRTQFANRFTLQFIPVVCGMLWIRFVSHKYLKLIPAYNNDTFKSEGRVFSMMWRAIIIWVIAGSIWNLYERLCPAHPWLRFIPIHPLWHCMSGYGALLCLQTVACMHDTQVEIDGFYLPLLTSHLSHK